jgi:hypothetical protein
MAARSRSAAASAAASAASTTNSSCAAWIGTALGQGSAGPRPRGGGAKPPTPRGPAGSSRARRLALVDRVEYSGRGRRTHTKRFIRRE